MQEGNASLRSSSSSSSALPALGHALSGATGSAVSNLATYPFDLIITRLQVQSALGKDRSSLSDPKYKGIRDAAQKIYENEGGIPGFYTGLWADTAKTVADGFFFFWFYDLLRKWRLRARGVGTGGAIPAVDELSVGFLAGSATKALTTPIANVVTRMQTSALKDLSENKGYAAKKPSPRQIAHYILTEKGVLGFWSGYSASLVLTLNPALTFFFFETLKRLTLPRSRRESPPPPVTFLIAAISKACASALTYPFSLAKARAQAGGATTPRPSHEQKAEKVAATTTTTTTLFGTIQQIAKHQGAAGLYEGLPLEILRGFLDHGITMIVKQAVHRLVIQTYWLLSRLVRRLLRRRGGLPDGWRDRGYEYFDLARRRAGDRAAEKLEEAQRVMQESVQGVLDKANETAELVADYVEEEAVEWRSLYGLGLSRWFEEK